VSEKQKKGPADSVLDLIGNTPLVRLRSAEGEKNPAPGAEIYAKLEGANPGGSVKDMIALSMIEDAEKTGKLEPGSTIIEATSGNTGIGLAMVASAKGYSCLLTMPDDMSVERRHILESYGARIIRTPATEGMTGAVARAESEASRMPRSFLPKQFDNPANPDCHYQTTGPEIYEQMDGRIDVFVAGVGTGGTITGVGRFLKEKNSKILIAAVEPAASPVLSGGKAKTHGIQGIGAGFVPPVLDLRLVDRIMTVADPVAFSTADRLARRDGLFVGISSGAAAWAAFELAKEFAAPSRIVVVFPDGGMKYVLG